MTYREWPNPGKWLTKNGQILDLPRLAKSRLTQKRIWWNQQPKAIFQKRAIPAYCKPEQMEFLNLLSPNAGESLWLNKDSSGILKLHKMVLFSSPEIVSLKFLWKNLQASSLLQWVDWLSLVTTTSSNGRTIPLKVHQCKILYYRAPILNFVLFHS